MNDETKKLPTPYEVSDQLFHGELAKAKQYDELVANLVAGHKIKPNETGDFQAVLGVVANMASAVNFSIDYGRPEGDISATIRRQAESVITAKPTSERYAHFFEMAANGTAKSAGHFQELIAKLHKVGAIGDAPISAEQVVDACLAPYLAGWTPKGGTGVVSADLLLAESGVLPMLRQEAFDAVQTAKQGDFVKLSTLLGRPEIAAPMKHIISARKALAMGATLGGEPLAEMVDRAVKDAESFRRISDTLSHYGQLRSASVVQSVKDLCHEYETIWGKLTKERFLPGDRVSDIVSQLLNDIDAQPRDAADAQEIANFLSDVYPTQNHSLPNAVRALFENYQRGESLAEELKSFLKLEEVYFEKGKLLDAVRNYVDLLKFFKKEDSLPGRLESTEEPLFLELVRTEIVKARAKFPSSRGRLAALVEEVGELSRALMEEPIGRVIEEAVQVAAMAWRIADEGDVSLKKIRRDNGQSPFPKTAFWANSGRANGVDAALFFIDESSNLPEDFVSNRVVEGMLNNPNHPENALARIGKALVDAGQLDPEEATRFGECAFAVEVVLDNKKRGDDFMGLIADRLSASGWLQLRTEPAIVLALEAALQNQRTNVGDAQIKGIQAGQQAANALVELSRILSPDKLLTASEIVELVGQMNNGPRASFRKTRAELLLLTKTNNNHDLVEEVRRLLSMSPQSTLYALESIREIVMTAEGNHNAYNTADSIAEAVKRHFRKMMEGVENWHVLGGMLVGSGALSKNAPLSFVNVKTALGQLIQVRDSFGQEIERAMDMTTAYNGATPAERIQAMFDLFKGSAEMFVEAGYTKAHETPEDFKAAIRAALELRDEVWNDLADRGIITRDSQATTATFRGGIDRLLADRDSTLAFPRQVADFLRENNLFDPSWPDSPEQVRAVITDVVIRFQKSQRQVGELIHFGPNHLFHILSDAGVMDTHNEADLPSLEQGIRRLIAERTERSSDVKSIFDELNKRNDEVKDLKDRNDAQTKFIVRIGEELKTVFPNEQFGFLASTWSRVRDLVSNLQHAKEAEAVLEELGPEFVGTLVQKSRTAVRIVRGLYAQQLTAVERLAAAIQKVGGVDLGDPSSVESIEAAILNLGWDRDRAVSNIKKRAFADGQRVFVHYFDGCSDEYLGQKPAEIRGAKYVSPQFGWFYMVEFEEVGIGGYKFDYAESRLALVAEAYLLPGDRVRIRDCQDEGTIVLFENDEYLVDQSGLEEGLMGRARFNPDQLIPIDQQWSIFARKEGKTRLLTLHAPGKWEAERRAAQRLSRAGKPTVTASIIAIPGVADNAHFGGETDTVEVRINRIAGRDVNLKWSHRFKGNDVDAENARKAITFVLFDQQDGSVSTSEGLEKMLPKIAEGAAKLREENVRAQEEKEHAAYREANPSRLFDDGQRVNFFESTETGWLPAIIHSVSDDSNPKARLYELRTVAAGSVLEGESRLRYEADLLPESLFKVNQRVIVKSPAYDKHFGKVISCEYSDWSKTWSYHVELSSGQVAPRWEVDLEAVPVVAETNHEALIQQSVENIVDREEQAPASEFADGQSVEVWTGRRWEETTVVRSTWNGTRHTYTVSHQSPMHYGAESLRPMGSKKPAPEADLQKLREERRPKPQFKAGDAVLVQPTGRRAKITDEPVFSAYKNCWIYPIEGEQLQVMESYLRPDLRPEPKFQKGEAVRVGHNRMTWFVQSFDWSTRGDGWLYRMTATKDGSGSSQGGVMEGELSLDSEALLSAFLTASRDLQANADTLVGTCVQIPTDALKIAKRDGAVNPDFLDWVKFIAGDTYDVKSVRVNNSGEVELKVDDSIFHYPVKYLSNE